MSHAIFTCNGGSNSLKCALFDAQTLALQYRMSVDRIHEGSTLDIRDAEDNPLLHEEKIEPGYAPALERILHWHNKQGITLFAAGHRIVHGGKRFEGPVRIDEDNLAAIQSLTPLAPLHQPHNLALVDLLRRRLPELPQIACFDTAFHRSQPELNQLYALPHRLCEEEGIVRYGFHGLSYEYIAEELPQQLEANQRRRVIAAHLGSGASMCALLEGKSIATTMGMTALDGLMMSTRCGDLDPGVVLYLLQHKQMSPGDIETLLYKQSGLLGVSGQSADMRDLDDKQSGPARRAVELFCQMAARQMGGLIALLGGIDALVFTGAMGVHDFLVRALICDYFKWLNLELDEVHNAENCRVISTGSSAVAVLTMPTDEERIIAQQTRQTLS